MTDKDKIKKYLDLKGISKNRFYTETGLSMGFLDSGRSLGVDKAKIIMNTYTDINLDWLVMDRGPMLKEQLICQDEQNKELCAHESKKGIPLIPVDAMAGYAVSGDSAIMEYDCEKYVIPNFRGADFLIPIKGNSMYPKFVSGDIVACKNLPIDTFFQWGKVYVLNTIQGALVKRIQKAQNIDQVVLVSENKDDYPPFELANSEIHSVALVVGVIRLV